jgi:hypothetical protein
MLRRLTMSSGVRRISSSAMAASQPRPKPSRLQRLYAAFTPVPTCPPPPALAEPVFCEEISVEQIHCRTGKFLLSGSPIAYNEQVLGSPSREERRKAGRERGEDSDLASLRGKAPRRTALPSSSAHGIVVVGGAAR